MRCETLKGNETLPSAGCGRLCPGTKQASKQGKSLLEPSMASVGTND